MKKPTVYEVFEWIGGYGDLLGKSTQLYYLPNKRSRKWRKSFSVLALSEYHLQMATDALNQENWYSYKFEVIK